MDCSLVSLVSQVRQLRKETGEEELAERYMVPKQLGSYHSLSDQLAMEQLVDQWFGKCSSEVECLGHYKVLSAGQKVEAAEVKAVEDEAIEAK